MDYKVGIYRHTSPYTTIHYHTPLHTPYHTHHTALTPEVAFRICVTLSVIKPNSD